MRGPLKDAIGHSIFASRLDTLLLRHTAVVVAFHRVKNICGGDGLTVSVPLFERYCRFFRHHFTSSRLVTGDPARAAACRSIVIWRSRSTTGTWTTSRTPCRSSEKLSLPGDVLRRDRWMGGDVVPWWDREAGVRHPWMTWEQVRTLHRAGFEIGAHTRTHVDLGAVGDGDARDGDSRRAAGARAELGAPVELFAYPYGRADEHRRLEPCAGQAGGLPLLLLVFRRRGRPRHRSVPPRARADHQQLHHRTGSGSKWRCGRSVPARLVACFTPIHTRHIDAAQRRKQLGTDAGGDCGDLRPHAFRDQQARDRRATAPGR